MSYILTIAISVGWTVYAHDMRPSFRHDDSHDSGWQMRDKHEQQELEIAKWILRLSY